MLQTLFYIPAELGGAPVFGFGLLLALWTIISVATMAWLGWRQGFNADTWGYVPLLAIVGAAIWFVLPAVCEPRGLPIRGYGMMLLTAVVAAVLLAVRRGRRVGIDPEAIYTLAFWMFLPGLIGSRLFYVIQHWDEYHRETFRATMAAVINLTQGGLVVYGALIGGVLGLLVFVRKYKFPLLATVDLIVPSMALGLALGRVGCLLNGCCFGGPSEMPWAITFPWDSYAHRRQVEQGQTFLHGLKIVGNPGDPPVITEVQPGSPARKQGLKAFQRIVSINRLPTRTIDEAQHALLQLNRVGTQISILTAGGAAVRQWSIVGPLPRSEPVQPTQPFSSINGLLVCLFLLAYDPFRRRDGELFALGMTIYPITRFLLEMVRTDERPVFGTGMTISQNGSLLVLIGAIALWFYILRRPPGRAFGGHCS